MKKILYRVESGDTVFSVVDKFGASPFSVIAENMLTEEISAGDMLVISPAKKLYSVRLGDTLCSVAKKFNEDKNELSRKNGNVPYLFYGIKIEI